MIPDTPDPQDYWHESDAALTAATRRARTVAVCFVLGLVIVAGCIQW